MSIPSLMVSPYIKSIEIIISIDWNYIAPTPIIASIPRGVTHQFFFEELAAC
jgi:hypothetical protein